MIIDRLAIALGYEYDSKELDEFNAKVDKTKKLVKGLSLATIGLITSFALLFGKLAGSALDQERFGRAVDISRKSLVAFQRTSEILTGSAGAATSLIEKLNGIRNAFEAGITPSDDFFRGLQKMGISFRDFVKLNPDEQIFAIAEGFQELDERSRDAVTALLNLNIQQRNLVSGLTRKNFRENLPTDIDIKKIEELEKALKGLKNIFKDLVLKIGVPLIDKITPTLKLIKENIEALLIPVNFAIDAITLLGEAIGKVSGFIKINIVEPLAPLFEENENFKEGFKSFLPSTAGGEIKNENNVTINNTVNANITTNNPERAGEIIAEKVGEETQKALNNFEGGLEN